MEALLEQLIVACAAYAYYHVTMPSPSQDSKGRRGRSLSRDRSTCSDDDTAYEDIPNKPNRLHAIYVLSTWFVVACGLGCYRMLARIHYDTCTASTFKAIMALINPSQCATYETYMNYLKSLGGMIIFAIIARAWKFFGIDTDDVLNTHRSIRRLIRQEYE